MGTAVRWIHACLVLLGVGASPLSEAAERAALIIGIDQYDHLSTSAQLRVAASDARLLGKTLSELPVPFAVTLLIDVDREAVSRAIDRFTTDAKGAECALIYFAGHGIEFHGENYLLVRSTKVSAKPDEGVRLVKDRLYYETISLNYLLDGLHETDANLKIVILDACRDNPLEIQNTNGARSIMGSRSGLGRVNAPSGMLVSYSADAGEQANDGLFTAILAEQIQRPGNSLMEVFARTRTLVRERSTELQAAGTGVLHEPAEYSKLEPSALGFAFVPPSDGGEEPKMVAQPPQGTPSPPAPPREPAMVPPAPNPQSERILEAKVRLAEIESLIESERKRYQDALALINKLTNNKRTPVVQGAHAHRQCMAASNLMGEIEQKAPQMKAEKAKLEATLEALGEPVRRGKGDQ